MNSYSKCFAIFFAFTLATHSHTHTMQKQPYDDPSKNFHRDTLSHETLHYEIEDLPNLKLEKRLDRLDAVLRGIELAYIFEYRPYALEKKGKLILAHRSSNSPIRE